jgi:hypothetical protein
MRISSLKENSLLSIIYRGEMFLVHTLHIKFYVILCFNFFFKLKCVKKKLVM